MLRNLCLEIVIFKHITLLCVCKPWHSYGLATDNWTTSTLDFIQEFYTKNANVNKPKYNQVIGFYFHFFPTVHNLYANRLFIMLK